jgi:hypothetical protein
MVMMMAREVALLSRLYQQVFHQDSGKWTMSGRIASAVMIEICS